MSGLAALDAKCSSRLGIMTISYYLWTTFVAVVVGIVMVYIIHPGGAAQKEDSEDSKKPMTSSADALLDLIRWVAHAGGELENIGGDSLSHQHVVESAVCEISLLSVLDL